ncbi:MAG: SDR family NAD(P)-dependent oxidoreductase [Desulfobacterales bacterium]|nr:SDR family NAD(P)-dependent oxidoreductase [Desulfobacterales bacterium]
MNSLQTNPHNLLRQNGVYLLTGGAGGLGLIFADYLASQVKARLVLVGRSSLNEKQSVIIQNLKDSGIEVLYLQGDVSKRDDIATIIVEAKQHFGEINGIIHAAGVIKDSYIIKKNPDDFPQVLGPKVYGTMYLDEATKDEKLDFFVLFSSVSAVTGNAGQCDYAYANSFMDNFAAMREKLREENKRHGKTLSINWPLWKEGGMNVSEETKKLLAKTFGTIPLENLEGFETFIKGLQSDHSQIMVIKGDIKKNEKPKPSKSLYSIQRDILKIISEILSVSEEEINPDENIGEYGFDSITFTELANRLNEKYKIDVTPAIFFEYSSVNSLSKFIHETYLGFKEEIIPEIKPPEKKTVFRESLSNLPPGFLDSRFRGNDVIPTKAGIHFAGKLVDGYLSQAAIIGMSCIMPNSKDYESFWKHLENGDDLITEVPKDRWDWRLFYGDPKKEPNKTNVKWGGFMPDADKFDPLFFGISPKEAELMDPQQRLFLQVVWQAIEDAGYKPSDLSGTDTGLFVGVSTSDYSELLNRYASNIEAHASTGMAHSVLANRISYILNLHGPSEPIDTACSSSLIAIHRAVEAIYTGSCDMAIAGGVHVMVTPSSTIAFSKAGMLSPDGRCKTFDKNADGYVRGEGVGAILIKPLSKAISDNDHIYGVILATCENHGGHATSLTAPNPKAQSKLLIKAYEKAKIAPDTITYIEAHGTGTSLGDPIEINALKNAFNELYKKNGMSAPEDPYCGLSSVKTNIGHLEAAAGIASIIKVLLSIKYKKIPKTILFKELNPYIELKKSPFHIVTETYDWNPSKNNKPIPRRAGISSFGFGGANAHIVIEEYERIATSDNFSESSHIIVLSAKNEERLRDYAKKIIDFIEIENFHISDIAYTLQVGREAFEERMAIIVKTIAELKEKLIRYINSEKNIEDFYFGNAKKEKTKSSLLVEGRAGKEFIKITVEDRELSKIAKLWVSGVEIDWNLMYQDKKPCRIPIPTYPFAKERYWLEEKKEKISNKETLLFEKVWEKSDYTTEKSNVLGHVVLFGNEYISENDYKKFLQELKYESSILVHLSSFSCKNQNSLDAVYSIFYFIKAIIELNLSSLNRILFLFPDSNPYLEAVYGYSKSLSLILPKLKISCIQVSEADIEDVLDIELKTPDLSEVKYIGKERYVRVVKPINLDSYNLPLLKENGVYLITGGLGGLGQIFAKYLIQKYKAKVILTGRSDNKSDETYIRADVANIDDMNNVIKTIKERYGALNGIIHAAGIVSKNPITQKRISEFEATLAPKVDGTVILDIATADEQIDFFVLFSSISSVLGDLGQCDYAVSNSFLDSFCAYRERLRNEGKRFGRTIAINWPLWREGGMHDNSASEEFYFQTSGMSYLEKEEGITVFEKILSSNYSNVIVLAGDKDRISGFFNNKPDIDSEIIKIASDILKISQDKLDINENLGNLGFDSINLKTFADKLSAAYKTEIPPAIFFAYSNIKSLANYLRETFGADVIPSKAEIQQMNAYLHKQEPIAVIGMHGIFPGSSDLSQFWANLEHEKDLITKSPKDRLNLDVWAGFIKDVDKFDAKFFKISPKEAEMMDPQHRLFIETVWKTIEDSGYKASSLSGKSVGVFVGVQFSDYQHILMANNSISPYAGTGNSHAMIANRVSFIMNWHGPSESIDSACSGSLVAVHHAIRSILNGESEIAIAGGVSLIISPVNILGTEELGVLSPDKKCKTFDAAANGYVKGEGVGAVLLKRLSRAIADGDNIYAVIKGAAINHGGAANSLTAPNSEAQADLLVKAYTEADFDPETITYLELHGTGTELGDPVEVEGIKKAFKELGKRRSKSSLKTKYCGIGSVKTNIGHLEPASGIAGMIKVILSMKNKKIPATLNIKNLNPYIKIENTPFYIPTKTIEWESKTPRRAGVSSFGFGGANAHVVLEEYERAKIEYPNKEHLIVISAKNKERLKEYAKNFLEFLNKNQDISVTEIAYTLMYGRETFPEAIKFVISDINELKEKLINYIQGNLSKDKIENNDWESIYAKQKPFKISLPTYPFARDRYWVDVKEQKFEINLTGTEFYLTDHVVQDQKTLPGAIYLEIARAYGGIYLGKEVTRLKEIVWLKPIIADDKNIKVNINFHSKDFGAEFEVADANQIYTRGKIFCDEASNNEAFDISEIKSRFSEKINSSTCYDIFKSSGLNYGPSFQVIQELYIGKTEAFAKITLPINENFKEYVLHPSIIDGALQAVAGLVRQNLPNTTYVPFLMGEVIILNPLTETCYSHVTLIDVNNIVKYNIDILDDLGKVIVKIKEFSLMPYAAHKLPKDLFIGYLKEIISKGSGTPVSEIYNDTPFENYGINSVMIINLTRDLEKDFGELSKTLFFEYQTISELSDYFIANHGETISAKFRNIITSPKKKLETSEDIAIIGISGIYPKASDLNQFWENLKSGKDCIEEIPTERWDYSKYYDDGTIYCKWGGFIEDIDKFDPLFFNISPREAELMDPQERLFLQTVWHTLEDAAYSKSSLSGKRVGVFAGVMYGEYQMLSKENIAASSSYASIVNRISYYFNFKGPSIAIDTMCSSSITAIHLACESIKKGESELAIAGGVNLSIHPHKYLLLSQAKFVSSDGRCRSFGEGGDGYVPGEGVGALLLKPLSRAKYDSDHIYGIIKGSAINHGGKTNGYTVPNPNAQADLISETLKNFKINPREISYVEAHGTGTSLGDPIEITGLVKAYKNYTNEKQYCAIGSVKSNIGHLESAAGIASVTKVLLQLKHKELVPSIHSEPLNSNINFSDTPFYVQKEVSEWKIYPRISAISSFGAGGSNAHIIIQEYDENKTDYNFDPPYLIVISAKDEDRLKTYAVKILEFLNKNEHLISDISYTLQIGREQMEERLSALVSDISQLKEKLAMYIKGEKEIDGLYTGNIKTNKQKTRRIDSKDLVNIAKLWVSGTDIDFNLLYPKEKPKRIPLPVYQFYKDRYWVPDFIDSSFRGNGVITAKAGVQSEFIYLKPIWVDAPLKNIVKKNVTLIKYGEKFDISSISENIIYLSSPDGSQDIYSIFSITKLAIEQKITHEIKLLYFYVEKDDEIAPHHRAMGAFFKTVRLENPKFIYKSICMADLSNYSDIALYEFNSDEDVEIRYNNGIRQIKSLEEVKGTKPKEDSLLKKDGVYLITGGAGAIGLILADYIIKEVNAKVILTGRSIIKDTNNKYLYIQADISNYSDAEKLVSEIKLKFGKINGIIHSAGITSDSFILKKTQEQIESVLSPKVSGTINLDRATKDEPLDFFILCSSISGIMGNAGQCDYAYANSFMDNFALWRKNLRSGKTISINWQLWQEGGMKLPKDVVDFIAEQIGVKALPTKEGIKIFEQVIKGEITYPQYIAVYGNIEKMRRFFIKTPTILDFRFSGNDVITAKAGIHLFDKTQNLLREIIGEILKISPQKISPKVNLSEYGIDSVMINSFNVVMEKILGEIPKTLLFEYQTLQDLSNYLIKAYNEKLANLFSISSEQETKIKASPQILISSNENDIAIIGMNGRYPKAGNLSKYWKNLEAGKDCVTEVPESRWDVSSYYDQDISKVKEGKIYCKWGAFIDDVDKFDPLFFNISPREAEILDPQERLFLETSWATIEDAGYTKISIKKHTVGVFVGITTNTYMLWGPEIWRMGKVSFPQSLPWSVANRVSYFFNFQGPSIPIDTACSSSLSAIHLACDSIKKGECDMALAGGVNLYLHPSKYFQLCQSRMLSTTRACKSFGAGGDGFIPGEGVGAILLKPLSKAISDKDYIYAVIKGTSINHGGKTTGYTVPNPNAHASLILSALKKTNINPETISYVEAHGTGTALGDPIEIRGLTLAYKEYTEKNNYCAIGSVKSNIGHLESAAGIAGLTKIVLQMQNKKLVPSLHCEVLNPNINFSNTPFYIQTKLSEWNNSKKIAAISSFGAGGSNAHLILEEYNIISESQVETSSPQLVILSAKNQERLYYYVTEILEFLNNDFIESDVVKIVSDIIKVPEKDIIRDENFTEYGFDAISLNELSLRLNEKYKINLTPELFSINKILDYLKNYSLHNIADISYTLQIGREPMEERIATVVSSVYELKEKFTKYLNKDEDIENFYTGNVKTNKFSADLLIEGEAGEAFIKIIINKRELSKIAKLWVNGVEFDWNLLYQNQNQRRIPLPTYPFAKERYFITPEQKPDQKEESLDFFYSSKLIPYSLKPIEFKEKRKILIIYPSDISDIASIFEELHPNDTVFKAEIGENPSLDTDSIDIIYHLGGIQRNKPKPDDFKYLDKAQEEGVLTLFRLIKILIERGLTEKPLQIKIITDNPFSATLFGLSRAIPYECPKVSTVCFDLSAEEITYDLIKLIISSPCIPNGEEIFIRSQKAYIRAIEKIQIPKIDNIPFKTKGVYLILGGSGGVGGELSLYLAKNFNAKLIWIGRSDLNPYIKEKIEKIYANSGEVFYIKGDVTDLDVMQRGIKEAKAKFGSINGAFHAANIPVAGLLNQINEDIFKSVLGPKVWGSLVLNKILEEEPLDFMMFFSSVQSFMKDRGSSHYAAACTFKDSYGKYLSAFKPYPVFVVNWGYFGSVGAASVYQKPLMAAMGFKPIESWEGMEAVHRIIANRITQVMPLKGEKRLLDRISAVSLDKNIKTEIKKLPDNILDHLKTIFSEFLKIDKSQFDINETFDKYGVDSIIALEITKRLELDFGELSPTLLFEYMTISKLCGYFKKEEKKEIKDNNIRDMVYKLTDEEVDTFLGRLLGKG